MLRIVYANLGYSRGINGSIGHHVGRGHRHVFTSRSVQLKSLRFVKDRLRDLEPDLSCFVEIDRGSFTNGFFDQLPVLTEAHHTTARIDNKYGADRKFRQLSVGRGKSNAFLATQDLAYETRYLTFGKKRLVYDIDIGGIRVLMAHCSLRHRVRQLQFAELAEWLDERDQPTVVVGDFNTFRGASELRPLLDKGMVHANALSGPTFRFGPYRALLDTCLVSKSIADRCSVEILDQPYSDHQMIKLDIRGTEALEGETLAEPIVVSREIEATA